MDVRLTDRFRRRAEAVGIFQHRVGKHPCPRSETESWGRMLSLEVATGWPNDGATQSPSPLPHRRLPAAKSRQAVSRRFHQFGPHDETSVGRGRDRETRSTSGRSPFPLAHPASRSRTVLAWTRFVLGHAESSSSRIRCEAPRRDQGVRGRRPRGVSVAHHEPWTQAGMSTAASI